MAKRKDHGMQRGLRGPEMGRREPLLKRRAAVGRFSNFYLLPRLLLAGPLCLEIANASSEGPMEQVDKVPGPRQALSGVAIAMDSPRTR